MIKRGLKNWKDISDLRGMLFLYNGWMNCFFIIQWILIKHQR